MRNFLELNQHIDDLQDKVYRLEQAVVALIAHGGHNIEALKLLTELSDEIKS